MAKVKETVEGCVRCEGGELEVCRVRACAVKALGSGRLRRRSSFHRENLLLASIGAADEGQNGEIIDARKCCQVAAVRVCVRYV